MNISGTYFQRLKEATENRVPIFFSGDKVGVVFQSNIISLRERDVVLFNNIPPAYISDVVKSSAFHLQFGMLRCATRSIKSDGKNLIFPFSDLEMIEETRKTERFPFTPEEHVVCELLNPYDKVTILSKQVMDMSASGLSVRSYGDSKLFVPGTLFEDAKILIDGALYSKTAVRVIYRRKLYDLQRRLRIQIGLETVG